MFLAREKRKKSSKSCVHYEKGYLKKGEKTFLLFFGCMIPTPP